MNICFFISDHGFGHIMRKQPVIVELLKRENRVVVVCDKKHIEIAGEYVMAECRNKSA